MVVPHLSQRMRLRRAFFWELIYTHAVPSLFLGILSIELLDWLTRQAFDLETVNNPARLLLVMAVNGVLVAIVVRLYQLWKRHLYGRIGLDLYNITLTPKQQFAAVAVGFMSGAVSLALLLTGWGLLLLTMFALSVAFVHWRLFTRFVVRMLQPNKFARWKDVRVLLSIYLTLLFCFSLANASLHMLHSLLGLKEAFLFPGENAPLVFDSFYFTVVTITTLGFGDIHPLSVDAKLLVSFEVLSSYMMFALILGLVTRGVLLPGKNPGEPEKK